MDLTGTDSDGGSEVIICGVDAESGEVEVPEVCRPPRDLPGIALAALCLDSPATESEYLTPMEEEAEGEGTGESAGMDSIPEELADGMPSAAGDRQSPDLLPRELEPQEGPSEGEGDGEAAQAVEDLLREESEW